MSEMTNGEKIGKYTKYQRTKSGISLTAFAKHIGVTPSFLMRLEQGVYQGVSLDALEKLSAGFHMSIIEFLRKCDITSYEKNHPSLDHYLKELYQFPPEAIADVKLFFEFIKKKYANEIKEMTSKHKKYWKKKI